VTKSQTLPRKPRNVRPDIWLISDARNDAVLESALAGLQRGDGFVFRHYHLDADRRLARFRKLARIARSRGIVTAWAGSPAEARRHGADAVYAPPKRLARAHGLLRVATVHGLRELAQAHRAQADLIMISPVFATRSHPGAGTLGPVRARLLARHAQVPVVMLGGMDARRARQTVPHGWAAIDGLSR